MGTIMWLIVSLLFIEAAVETRFEVKNYTPIQSVRMKNYTTRSRSNNDPNENEIVFGTTTNEPYTPENEMVFRTSTNVLHPKEKNANENVFRTSSNVPNTTENNANEYVFVATKNVPHKPEMNTNENMFWTSANVPEITENNTTENVLGTSTSVPHTTEKNVHENVFGTNTNVHHTPEKNANNYVFGTSTNVPHTTENNANEYGFGTRTNLPDITERNANENVPRPSTNLTENNGSETGHIKITDNYENDVSSTNETYILNSTDMSHILQNVVHGNRTSIPMTQFVPQVDENEPCDLKCKNLHVYLRNNENQTNSVNISRYYYYLNNYFFLQPLNQPKYKQYFGKFDLERIDVISTSTSLSTYVSMMNTIEVNEFRSTFKKLAAEQCNELDEFNNRRCEIIKNMGECVLKTQNVSSNGNNNECDDDTDIYYEQIRQIEFDEDAAKYMDTYKYANETNYLNSERRFNAIEQYNGNNSAFVFAMKEIDLDEEIYYFSRITDNPDADKYISEYQNIQEINLTQENKMRFRARMQLIYFVLLSHYIESHQGSIAINVYDERRNSVIDSLKNMTTLSNKVTNAFKTFQELKQIDEAEQENDITAEDSWNVCGLENNYYCTFNSYVALLNQLTKVHRVTLPAYSEKYMMENRYAGSELLWEKANKVLKLIDGISNFIGTSGILFSYLGLILTKENSLNVINSQWHGINRNLHIVSSQSEHNYTEIFDIETLIQSGSTMLSSLEKELDTIVYANPLDVQTNTHLNETIVYICDIVNNITGKEGEPNKLYSSY